jgi:hypothetical protein
VATTPAGRYKNLERNSLRRALAGNISGMDENPYRSPQEAGHSQPARRRAQPWRLIPPLLWIGILFFGLPTVQQIPLFVRIASTLATLSALWFAANAGRGWWLVAVIPLCLALGFLQALVWTFPR